MEKVFTHSQSLKEETLKSACLIYLQNIIKIKIVIKTPASLLSCVTEVCSEFPSSDPPQCPLSGPYCYTYCGL